MARNTLAVASQRSVRRISSGPRGARVRHGDRGRNRIANRVGRCKPVLLEWILWFRQAAEQAELTLVSCQTCGERQQQPRIYGLAVGYYRSNILPGCKQT